MTSAEFQRPRRLVFFFVISLNLYDTFRLFFFFFTSWSKSNTMIKRPSLRLWTSVNWFYSTRARGRSQSRTRFFFFSWPENLSCRGSVPALFAGRISHQDQKFGRRDYVKDSTGNFYSPWVCKKNGWRQPMDFLVNINMFSPWFVLVISCLFVKGGYILRRRYRT